MNTPPSPTFSPEQLAADLRWRYATKQFDPAAKVAPALLKALEDALLMAPSSFGLQPWHFIVVSDPAVRAKLREAAWNQPQVTDAPHFIVLCARREVGPADVEKFTAYTEQLQGLPAGKLDGYKNMMLGFIKQAVAGGMDTKIWATKQVYIALGFLMAAAASLRVDTCPMEGISPPDFDRILGLDGTPYTTVVTVAVGHRAATDKHAGEKKSRYPAAQVIRHV
jgi:nitroreductase